jgi:polyhydroxybutyrate depolymerase
MLTLPCFFFLLMIAEPTAEERKLKVDGVERSYLIYLPTRTENAPVVFGFHGHGGTARNAARTFEIQKHWPEAICVYMQGLNTPGKTDPEGKKPGWQNRAGLQDDRDLKFLDAVWKEIQSKHQPDAKRVYATGHSNGGGFSYLLLSQRNTMFAAFAPSAAGAAGLGVKSKTEIKPRPVFHVAGTKDDIVPFENQKKTIEALKQWHGCESTGKPWDKQCTLFEAKNGPPVVTFIHEGTHKYPAEAPAFIVKFFKEHRLP